MPHIKNSTGSEAASSVLFAHAADEELKGLVLPCLQGFREIYTADSAGEALELYNARLPGLVVAAMELGDMNGFELGGRIRTVIPEAQIILIGRTRGESLYKHAMEAGIRYVLMDEHVADSLKITIDESYALREFRRVQQQVGASNRLQADILRELPLPVALLSATGELLSGNRAFSTMVGLTDETCPIPLSSALDAMPAADSARGWNELLNASAKGLEWSGTVTCRVRNGARKHIHAVLSRVQSVLPGSGQYRQLVLNDITANENQCSHLSVQRYSAFEIIESIRDASEIGELKSLARLLVSDSLPAALPFSLRTLIASVISSFSSCLKDHGKELRTTVPLYLPDLYLGSQSALSRILSCLLGNSLENGEGDGITLKVDLKEKNDSGTCIQFAVEFRSSRAVANVFESMQDYLTGLDYAEDSHWPKRGGLSLVAALIEKLGGMIWVKSMMSHSTTYCFSLCLPETSAADAAVGNDVPLRESQPAQNTGSQFGLKGVKEAQSSASPRILLADDNAVDQLTIRRLLESMDYEVICVSNGREAVEEFDTSSCDAVLMDILMPDMDGFEATRMIREKERLFGGGHTPIIALTSYALKAIHEKCVTVGMDSYLHKPVSAQDLATLFRSILQAGPVEDGILNRQEVERLPLIDFQDTFNNMDNNKDLYREVMGLFATSVPIIHQELVTAICTGALTGVRQSAHKIKGMSANVGAKRYAELARQIEEAALAGNLGDSSQWLSSLSTEFTRLQEAITIINWQQLH
ncbi:MAG: response regulator [Desulfuromonadales bacterium]